MPQGNAPGIFNFLPLIIIFVVFYFLIIMPQKKQQKKHQEMIAGLGKNDEVVTAGGVYGVIVNVKERTFVIRIDDNARMEIDKSAVSYKVTKS